MCMQIVIFSSCVALYQEMDEKGLQVKGCDQTVLYIYIVTQIRNVFSDQEIRNV